MFQMLWSIIHKYAISCKNSIQKKAFKLFIDNLAENFPCDTCKPHFKKMLNDVKIEYFENKYYNGEDVSCFYWTFHMHNLVNIRLGKKILNFDEAYNIHINNSACTECNANNNNNNISEKIIRYINTRRTNEYSNLEPL